MARTYEVKKARKDQGNCRACGKPIIAGMGYKYKQPRYGACISVHTDCPMKHYWGSSSKMVAIWEALDNPITDKEGLNSLAETVREVAGEYQEGVDSQREYFPDSPSADENEEKAQNLEQWADEIEEAANTVEGLASELEELEGKRDELKANMDAKEEEDDEYDSMKKELEEVEGEIEGKQSEIKEACNEATSNCPE